MTERAMCEILTKVRGDGSRVAVDNRGGNSEAFDLNYY